MIIDKIALFIRPPVYESIRHPLDAMMGLIGSMAVEIYESCNPAHLLFQ
jgi:hypothetical protein